MVAFTSENGVLCFFRELDAQRRDARAFGRARVAAIGTGHRGCTPRPRRARRHRPRPISAARRSPTPSSPTPTSPPRSPAAALASSSHARSSPARCSRERLREQGCEVNVVPVYETRPASAERRAELVSRLEARAIDVVLLTSSSTADSLCDLLGPRAAELLARVAVASIGPITTATAEKRGLTVAVTATVSTMAGLVAALEGHFAAGVAG